MPNPFLFEAYRYEVYVLNRKKWIVQNRMANSLFDHLIKARNINANLSESFFSPTEKELLDPETMYHMDQALNRIEEALDRQESIWIYGDYDVDGISAVSILLRTFRKLGKEFQYYIPKRIEEGYGINKEAIEFIRSSGGDLMISVDCGITSVSEIEYAKSIGLDVIVTDHHQCKESLPDAVAVIDPKQPDCDYENINICGAGIALKMAQGILQRRKPDADWNELLEIAAVATIADIVELSGENRTIVRLGLNSLREPKTPGLGALLKISGMDLKNLNSANIAYTIAPKINSSGRLGKANIGVDLLMAETESEAESIAQMLELLNKQRQSIESEIYEEALQICKNQKENKVLVAASLNWHSGVIGIVASKITDYFHKPSMIIAIEEGNKGKGSGRSIDGFNLFAALNKIGELLEKFGGHEQAAGITIDADKISVFEKRINAEAEQCFGKSKMMATLSIDAKVSMEELNLDLYRKIELLEPFGIGNPRPLLLLADTKLENCRLIGKNQNHVKAKLSDSVEMIGFNKAEDFKDIDVNRKIDIVFELDRNEYMGRESLQLLLRDVKQSLDIKEYVAEIRRGIRMFKQRDLNCTHFLEEHPMLPRFTWEELRDDERYLFLVYSLDSLRHVIKNLYYRNIDFSIKQDIKKNISTVLIMPIIDKMDVSGYNNIILCDEDYERILSVRKKSSAVSVLQQEGEKFHLKIPSRTVMVKLYSLISKKPSSVYNMEQLCAFLETDLFGLILSLEILGDMSYVSYDFDSAKQNVKIVFTSDTSNKKYDLSETQTVRAFEGIC